MAEIVHLISDSTGETVSRIGAAAFTLFPERAIDRRLHVFIRSSREALETIDRVKAAPGLVILTMVDPEIRALIAESLRAADIPVVAALEPIVKAMEGYLGETAQPKMGGQYTVDDSYFRRVDAIDFAIGHDDGAVSDRLSRADLILAGVSRTSKTPTCIYLAVRGVKAANLPLVPNAEPPQAFFDAIDAGVPVVGLTANPNRLAQIRTHRLETIGHDREAEYAALDAIRREVSDARLLFERIGAPVIDVTRKSIEETAAAIMAIVRHRAETTE